MSWKTDCPGVGQAPAKTIDGVTDPSGADRQAGVCPACDHRHWMDEPDVVAPHGAEMIDVPRPKGTRLIELDD